MDPVFLPKYGGKANLQQLRCSITRSEQVRLMCAALNSVCGHLTIQCLEYMRIHDSY